MPETGGELSPGDGAGDRQDPAPAAPRTQWFYYVLGLSLQTLLWFLLFLGITIAVLVGGKLTEFRYVGF